MNKIKLSEAISEMLIRSRSDSGKSQDFIAKALGVSKRTVQNWEAGDACPNLATAIQWFDVIGVPMYPYLMDVLYPKQFQDIKKTTNMNEIRDALRIYVDELDDLRSKELLYLLYGAHGSSPTGTIDLINTYLHLPLPMRVSIATNVLIDYEIASSSGNVKDSDYILPAIETLRKYVSTAKTAVINGKDTYIFEEEDQ